MTHRGVSVVMRGHLPQSAANFTETEQQDHEPDTRIEATAHPVFATRAQAQLLDVLGWQIVPSPRRDAESHAPLQCCFILRDGRREEAVFGYTGHTAPFDPGHPELRAAQARVEYFLSFLGEDRGLLLQNRPLLSFSGRQRDKVAVFGGWRFQNNLWKPFLLGPGGFAGVPAQETLFAGGVRPQHMAEIYGHSSRRVMPQIATLVREIAMLNPQDDEEDETSEPGPGFDGLQILRGPSGWFRVRPCRPSIVTSIRRIYHTKPLSMNNEIEKPKTFWESGADEFQFHRFGMDRSIPR